MELYKQINIDLYNPYPLCIMKAKQGDTARGALITLTGNGEILVPTTESIQIYATKPDGTKIYNTCTIVGNQIQVKFTDQMLALPGNLLVEIEMIDGQDILSTPIFLINVLPTNIDANAIESTNEFTALQTAIAEATAYKAEYLKKPDAVLDSTQASTDSNTGHLEFQGKPFYPEIPGGQLKNAENITIPFTPGSAYKKPTSGETLGNIIGELVGNSELHEKGLSDLEGDVGEITGLNTTVKTSTVAAINEVNTLAKSIRNLKVDYITAYAICSETATMFGGKYYGVIQPSYSQMNGKNIMFSYIGALITDSGADGTLQLSTYNYDTVTGKITDICVYSTIYQTARVKIIVVYSED